MSNGFSPPTHRRCMESTYLARPRPMSTEMTLDARRGWCWLENRVIPWF